MPIISSFEEHRMAHCPACGYPTLGSDLCAPCVPVVAAAQASAPSFSPAA